VPILSSRKRLLLIYKIGELGGKLLILPALILVSIFVIFPVIWSAIISFTDLTLVGPKAMELTFIGIKNYMKLLSDPDFYNSIKVSFLFTLFSALIGQAFLGLLLAILLRMEGVRGKLPVTLAVFIAWILPEVVTGYMWGAYASRYGLLNILLRPLGIGGVNWLYEKPLETIIIANIWRGTAFSMILFMAALESIPSYIYDAAEVDGASKWQKFRYITLPLIAHVILIDFILITIWTFGVFTMIFVMAGRMGGATELWTIFAYYRALTPPYKFGYAAAATNIMCIIVIALIATYLKLIGRLERW